MRFLLVLLTGLALTGCGAGGAITQKVFGPPAIQARHKLRPLATMILVENYRTPGSLQLECESLTRQVTEEFNNHKLAALVDTDPLYNLRDADSKAYRKLSIPDAAKLCGARQVVYVDLLGLSVTTHSGDAGIEGESTAMVRVVDADSGSTLWPEDASGAPISFKLPVRAFSDEINANVVRQKVISITADRIARLFYSYKPDEVEK